jgi:hypothetical protein
MQTESEIDVETVKQSMTQALEALGFAVSAHEGYGRIHLTARKGDQEITARAGCYDLKDRAEFKGHYPNPKETRRSDYGRTWHSITCAMTKTAEQMRRDIERRLLPGYLAELEKVRQQNQEADRYELTARANLALVIGRPISENAQQSHKESLGLPGNAYGSARCSADSCNLEINSIPPALAADIVKLVRDVLAKEEATS